MKLTMMVKKFVPTTAVLLGVGLLTSGPAAQSQTLLNVKIGKTANDYSGGGGPESNGAYQESPLAVLGSADSWWNEYAFVSSTPSGVSVVDSTGSTFAGVSLTVQNTSGVGSLSVSGNPSFLMDNMPYQNPGPGNVYNISLSGLQANTQYEFVGYAANPNYSAGASWTVTTGTPGAGVFSNDGSSADITTGVGKAYSRFFVTTDGAGSLAITDASQSGTYPILQGFQLAQVIPEPATFGLAGLGLISILARRRRLR